MRDLQPMFQKYSSMEAYLRVLMEPGLQARILSLDRPTTQQGSQRLRQFRFSTDY